MSTDIIIENKGLRKTLFLHKGRIASSELFNKLSSERISAQQGSEEFILGFRVGPVFKKVIRASALKVKSVEKVTDENGDTYTVVFSRFRLADSRLSVKLVYTYKTEGTFIRKHIELSYDKRGSKSVVLDFIDFESFRFDSALKHWTIPSQPGSHVPGYALEMGQPVYVGSMYMGAEFPAALNKIKSCTTSLRYFSGKRLPDIMKENTYKSREAVLGAALSDSFPQVQRAFFEYIRTVSKPVRLRRQYNSWYDHMLNITRENVYGSFLEIEKAMTGTGEKPLDCYVVDDGWNDYSKDFWSFNQKFPDELYPFSSLARALSSSFGLWIGPRGGYTGDTPKFAKKIERAGNGYFNKSSRDICVASNRYIAKTAELMLDFQNRFSLNYWKLDGFAQRPCKNKHHDHITGGFNSMHFYTDVWEKWTQVFDKLYENGRGNYWINLTCYAPPSPWFLRYVNSLWMQVSDDVGFIGKKGIVSDKDRMLSYRDERYFDFYRDRQFQFPQYALYNHDPIYGNEAKVNMSDGDFRAYLFTMAMRGSCFWELYYSYNMMNEAKWRINYSVMRFLEDNTEVLSNSVIFGSRPSENRVYGFSAFGENEGILCLRNPTGETADYTVRLDENIGASKNLIYAPMVQLLPYSDKGIDNIFSYGDTVRVSLAPYETKIMHLGKRTKELRAEYVTPVSSNTLQVTFNQTVCIKDISCESNNIKEIRLLEDYMTAEIVFEEKFNKKNTYSLCNIKDVIGNIFHTDITFMWYDDFIVTDSISGVGAFSVKATLTSEDEGMLMKQGEDISLYIAEDKHFRFTVGNVTLRSEASVRDKVQVMAVREKTGALKLYLDGILDSGIYAGLFSISEAEIERYNEGKVIVYNKAIPYDEV